MTSRNQQGRTHVLNIPDSKTATTLQNDEYAWVVAESKRRGCSVAQIIRDAFYAYRKLEPDAAPVKLLNPNYKPASFR